MCDIVQQPSSCDTWPLLVLTVCRRVCARMPVETMESVEGG